MSLVQASLSRFFERQDFRGSHRLAAAAMLRVKREMACAIPRMIYELLVNVIPITARRALRNEE
jgi:hypothetical protein